ncbi:MAG: sulfatase-like hydrolase/transferase [Lentisphaerae bacterium]|jgi:arylsulfatase A-like enzyme|nr:sulfatase-like hydrolase/transferase [Lentisphaerota bacterium]MBT4820079.1 sulfatase-like hydrolase/transferase [Lentisphaerota bacterium]MBT5606738.1 sulfatase-like hydrolase/transferase [Lentisphaerota bacterium]MBT7847472.1 sulfatase-like hydrolase/transferase [Lentisphaerota bacterium]
MASKPNIVIIMTDQQQARLCAREGYPLDTTPFLDSLACGGAWFNRAYTANPTCAPARVSMFTGRFPSATRVRSNHNLRDVTYTEDLCDVLRGKGYTTALCGKNHSHLNQDNGLDYIRGYSHDGGHGEGRTEDEKACDAWLKELHHGVSLEATPFPVECQPPVRVVRDAINWIDTVNDQPFFLWMSFAEPHNPFQVPEPYYSMFPPEDLPPKLAGPESLAARGYKWRKNHELWRNRYPNYDAQLARQPSNYLGMLRLIDDQVKRFVEYLDKSGQRENTMLVFVSDHGDFCGEYGLIRKGPEMPEMLMRIPLLFNGPGICDGAAPRLEHVSIVDIMPTLCELAGADLPDGVQGRSLLPLLRGEAVPTTEFASVYGEQGFGGQNVTDEDGIDPEDEGAYNNGCNYDCLNTWTQSGSMRMVRKDYWKLIFDIDGRGQLFNVEDDPAELDDHYDDPACSAIRDDLHRELLTWMHRAQDPLPHPRNRYRFKRFPHNYQSGA